MAALLQHAWLTQAWHTQAPAPVIINADVEELGEALGRQLLLAPSTVD